MNFSEVRTGSPSLLLLNVCECACVWVRMCLHQTENCLRGYGVGVERRTDKPNDFMYRIGGMHRTIRSCKQFKASVPSLNTYLLFALAIRDFSLENLFESQKPSQLLSFIRKHSIDSNQSLRQPKDWFLSKTLSSFIQCNKFFFYIFHTQKKVLLILTPFRRNFPVF